MASRTGTWRTTPICRPPPPTSLVAEMTRRVDVPAAVAGAVPERWTVSPVMVTVSHDGASGPTLVVRASVGAGEPVTVTVVLVATPGVNTTPFVMGAPVPGVLVAVFRLGGWSIVRVRSCVVEPAEFVTVSTSGYVPADPFCGEPPICAVPFFPAVKVTPAGSAPERLRVGTGKPTEPTVHWYSVPVIPKGSAVENPGDVTYDGASSTSTVSVSTVVP